MHDVWGIDGTVFAIGYAVLALGVCAAALVMAVRLRQSAPRRPARSIADLDPYQVAYLRGGATAAVAAAVMALCARQAAVRLRNGKVVTAGSDLASDSPALEHAVLASIGYPTSLDALPHARPVHEQLQALDQGLVSARLLIPPSRRQRLWIVGLAAGAVAALGVARLVAETIAQQPNALFGPVLFGFLILATVLVARGHRLVRRTPAGDDALAALRQDHQRLKPPLERAWTRNEAHDAAMAVALFGARAMLTGEPRGPRSNLGGNAEGAGAG